MTLHVKLFTFAELAISGHSALNRWVLGSVDRLIVRCHFATSRGLEYLVTHNKN